jgi:hypothetical protein
MEITDMSNPNGFTWQSWADTQDDAIRDDDSDYEEQDEEIILRQEKDYDDWSRT